MPQPEDLQTQVVNPPATTQPEPTETPGFGELFKTAARQNFLFAAKQDYENRMSHGQPVEGYKPSYDDVSKMQKDMGLTPEQGTILSGALSPEELQYRASEFQKKNDGKRQLDNAGWKGMAAEMLSYAADPTMLPGLFVKSPYVVARALSTIGIKTTQSAVLGAVERAVGAGIVGAGMGVAQEAGLTAYDESRDANDIAIAAASGLIGGVVFSGAADALGAGYRAATATRALGREMNETVERLDWSPLALTNDAEKTINIGVTNRLMDSDYARNFKGLEGEIPDPVARKRVLNEGQAINQLIGDLTPTAEARMARGERMELEGNIKSGRYEMDQLNNRISELEATPPTGSGKQLATARAARSQELASLRQQVQQQQSRIDDLNLTLEPHRSGEFAQAVSDISRLRNGIIPDNLKAKYLDLITPDDAAPAHTEALSNLPPKDEAPVLPQEAARVEEESLSPTVDKTDDTSVGAKEAEGVILFSDTDTQGALISEAMGKALSDMRTLGEQIPIVKAAGSTSIYARVMSRMKDNTLRGVGALVFNDPHGARTAVQSSVAWADAMRTRIMPKFAAIENMARDEFINRSGINQLFNPAETNRAITDFNRQVSIALNELTSTTIEASDSAIVKAAKARAGAYQEALEVAKRYGVRGFEDVESRASYQTVKIGRNDMTTAMDNYGEDEVREALVRGYMGAKKPLSQKSATLVADAYLDRYYRGTSAVVSKSSKPSNRVALQAVQDELKASGVPEKEIQTVLNMIENKELDANISARAMDSLHPDINATTLNGLRFVDLMDTSQGGVDQYVRELTASASFARYGINSRRQMEDTITEAFKGHRKDIEDLTIQYKEAVERKGKLGEGVDSSRVDKIITDYERAYGKGGKDLTSYRKFLDSFEEDYFDGVKVAFGEPISEATAGEAVASNLGKLTNMMLLGFSGIAQVADMGITIARTGVGAVLRNLPTSLYHGARSLLPSQDYFMRNTELTQIAEIMGSISHQDYLFGHKMMNGAEYGDAVIGQVTRAGKVLDNIGWAQSSLSLLRPMQGMIDELSARSLLSNVVSLSRGGTFSGKTRKSFLEIGRMSEESLDNSLRHIKARMDSGEDLYAAVRTLDPKLRDELGTAIRSVHNSNIGRAYFGELPAFSNKAMGKMFLKLQSFALTAYEKGIQRGLRNDQAGFIAATAWSAGIAYMWAEADVRIQSLKVPEDKRDEYVTKRLDDQRLYTVAGRMSQLAAFSTMAQIYNVANPYGNDTDSALSPLGKYQGMAPLGAVGKVGQGIAAGARLATDESNNEEADKYKVYGAIPLLNTVTGMAVLNTL